jgi:hypothetical protein
VCASLTIDRGLRVDHDPGKAMVCVHRNGLALGVYDGIDVYYAASTEVKVSREEAIRIAKSLVEEKMGRVLAEQSANIASINASLVLSPDTSGARGDMRALYPKWIVRIEFSKPVNGKPIGFNGAVYGYEVAIWADTGEVAEASPRGIEYYYLGKPSRHWLGTKTQELLILVVVLMLLAIAVKMLRSHRLRSSYEES